MLNQIPYIPIGNRKISSANIQAEFYRQCKEHNIPCLLEHRHGGCRFDAVVHDGARLLVIIEAKNYSPRRLKRHRRLKQMDKYAAFGIPTMLIRCMEDVPPAIAQIKQWMNQ